MKVFENKVHFKKWGTMDAVLILSSAILFTAYWFYQKSIAQAVYSTTVSFMEQIADHDHLNAVNHMGSKLDYLNSIMERIRFTRNGKLENIVYNLGVESSATSFEKLYLITGDDKVYSNSYLEASIESMPWGKIFQESEGDFVIRHNEDNREQLGEYLLYGSHLMNPIQIEDKEVVGIVGTVPITSIVEQMRLESFDGQGVTILMQSTGEVITASDFYDYSINKNIWTMLKNASFSGNKTFSDCQKAISKEESLFVQCNLNGRGFYFLFQPLKNKFASNWYLVVQVSTEVTEIQTKALILRSIPFFLIIGILILAVTFVVYHNINATHIARASEQAKSTFLTNMSHEIRTPLNGIVGLQFLMGQNLDNKDKLNEYLKKAQASAEFLKGVINDVLDMSKIESGQLENYQAEMSLSDLAADVKELLIGQAEEKEIEFYTDCSKITYPNVLGDALRVKQILMNLLGNGIKFTPKGGRVSMTIHQELVHETVNTTFIIEDTGCGMSTEFLKKIWVPFEQERRLASVNGTGLGTTLSKNLTERMGGEIKVESQVNEGTKFTVTIPFPVLSFVPEETKKTSTQEWELAGKQILVVEDNEINRMIITSILEAQGCILTEAVNGQEAVTIFENSANQFFDLILMDIQMPVMDGFTATKKIRELSREDSSLVPIFAITANAFREDTNKAIASGMNDVITKPIDISLLLEKIKNLHNLEEQK